MIYGVKWVMGYLMGTDIAGRALAVYPDDTFIVSYPRSGNTWTRFLVANLLHPNEPVSFDTIERLVPDAEAQSSKYLKQIPRPRFIKSHQYFDHRYKKVIYVVRDPRDVALSYYNFSRKYRYMDDAYPLERFVSDFVQGRLSSADWGTWGENVGSWMSTRFGRKDFLLLRYEDMIANPEPEIVKMAEFFEIKADAARICNTVERSSAHNMRELEKVQGKNWISTKDKRPDIPFIGSAESGRWKSKLSNHSVAEIEAAWGPLMFTLGYELMATRNLGSESSLRGAISAAPR